MRRRETTAFDLVKAQAQLHQHFFIGLQLRVSMVLGPTLVEDWMFHLFRRQHEEKFLSSFEKLGLKALPDAVASAKYHVLSNGVGGVRVEYMEESSAKAWIRYRYPRWWLDGPAVCGIPVEASKGFMRGWHANNGVSLGNPRLGFVCVSEDMTGEFGFCGYFQEYDHELTESERLQYAKGERPPIFDPAVQPRAPAEHWNDERLAKGNRNYAIEFVRNGITSLVHVAGRRRALEVSRAAARLTGLQQYASLAESVNAKDGTVHDAARFLGRMFEGMGDRVEICLDASSGGATVTQSDLRIVRGLEASHRSDVLTCWVELWKGAVASHREFFELDVSVGPDSLVWTVKSC